LVKFLSVSPVLILAIVSLVGSFPLSDFLILRGLEPRQTSLVTLYGVLLLSVGTSFAGWIVWKKLPEGP